MLYPSVKSPDERRWQQAMLGNNYGSSGAAGEVPASFSVTLLASLIPQIYTGSSTPTFTRATTAYVTDFEGLLKQVPSGASRHTGARFVRNFVPNSEVTTGWLLNTITATAGQTDPLGGTTAFRLTATAASNNVMYQSVTYPSGATSSTVTWSAWIKRVTGTGNVRLALNSGTVTATLALTTSWQRFSVTGIGGAGGVCNFNIYVDTNGDAVDVAFMLGEEVAGQSNTNPSEYVSKGVLSAPFHGAGVDGCKYFTTQNGNTVASNVVTEATGAAISSATLLGYQAEGARTNRCLQSQVFSNAAWVSGGGGIAVTDNSIAAPDGTTTADTLTASGANGTLIQDLGTVASAAKAGGLWIKRKTGTGNVDLTLDGGATWTNITVTAGWTRVQKTQTLADEDFGIRIVTSGDEVYAWQGQVETASFLSSDIPTTTVAVARNGDYLTYSSASNVLTATGTAYIESRMDALNGAGANVAVGDTAVTSVYLYMTSATNARSYEGGALDTTGSGLSFLMAPRKMACAWGGATRSLSKDGAAAVNAAFSGTFAVGATFSVGGPAGFDLFGTVRNLSIWTTKKTDAELAALTA